MSTALRLGLHALVGAVAGAALTVAIMIMGASIFWIFIFGDDTWPTWATNALMTVAFGAGFATLGGAVWLGWRTRPS